MKINAVDMLLNNKNLKLKGDEAESSSQALALADAPESEDSMNALNAQSMNNIAFQGVNMTTLTKKGLNAMVALTLLSGAAGLTSCDDDYEYPRGTTIIYDNTQVVTNITVNIYMTDEELVSAVLEEIKALREEQKEQTEINKAILAELIKQGISLERIMKLLEQMNMTAQDIFNMLKDNKELQEKTLEEISGGNKELKALLTKILNAVNKGHEFTAATNRILTALFIQLGQANKNDKELIAIVNAILAKIDQAIQEGKDIQAKQEAFYNAIIEKLSTLDTHLLQGFWAVIQNMNNISDETLAALTKILNKLDDMSEADKKFYDNMTSKVDKLDDDLKVAVMIIVARMDKMDAHMRAYASRLLEEAIKGNKTSAEILKALGNLMDKVDEMNENQKEFFQNALDKFDVLDDDLKFAVIIITAKMDKMDAHMRAYASRLLEEAIKGNKTSAEILKAIGKLMDKIDEMNENQKEFFQNALGKMDELDDHVKQGVLMLINNMDKCTDELLAAANKIIENQDRMSQENKEYFNKFMAQLQYMDKNGQRGMAMLLQQLALNNTISAQTLNTINKVLQRMEKAHQDDLKFYNQALAILAELASKADKLGDKADSIIDAIGNITLDGNIDLATIEQLLRDLLAQSKANGDVLTSVDSKMNLVAITLEGIKTLVEGLGGDNEKLLAKLDQILAKIPEGCKCDAKLEVIIEKLQNIIEQIKNGNNHEGILDDLDNMFD